MQVTVIKRNNQTGAREWIEWTEASTMGAQTVHMEIEQTWPDATKVR